MMPLIQVLGAVPEHPGIGLEAEPRVATATPK
jgi:hypothetical protein